MEELPDEKGPVLPYLNEEGPAVLPRRLPSRYRGVTPDGREFTLREIRNTDSAKASKGSTDRKRSSGVNGL